MPKPRTILERPEGYGQIRTSDGKSFAVRYSLVVFHTIDPEAETGPIASHVEIRGALAVNTIEGLVDLTGKRFILRTSDGRCLEVQTKSGDPVSRHWEIVSTAPGELRPC
jgi:hypothetical protein